MFYDDIDLFTEFYVRRMLKLTEEDMISEKKKQKASGFKANVANFKISILALAALQVSKVIYS